MSSPRTRIYIVDDDSLLRDALVRLLAQAQCQARTFDSGGAFLRAYPNLPAGCIIMDLKMPGMSGLELQRRLLDAGCRWPVIVLTGHGDDTHAERAIAAGAIAFLEKPARRWELYGAIVKAEAYLAGATDAIPDPELAYRAAQLTRRERDTLSGVLEKKINKEIAAELGITESSVKSYRHNVMRKMGAKTTAELVMLALRAGFRVNSRR
ncbi:MAG TPA: response regulator [Steroidobacteraceae bacterium]|jgi:FixJ family two-component response regulator|nr:response regulator [Steroidobacteraceae bacterium]